jgi:hypothetical protein
VPERDDALAEVIGLIERHGLTLHEVSRALRDRPATAARRSSSILTRLFGYIGGTFVLVGLAIYIGMRWDDLGSAGRVLLTLGPGFSALILALVCLGNEGFRGAATPLFLLAALIEPTGILVLMHEYSHGGDPAYGVLFMSLVMTIQQACLWLARPRTVLAFTTIVFALSAYTVALDLLDVNHDLMGIVAGASLGCVAWSLDRSTHRSLAGVVYFVGAFAFLSASYDAIRHTPVEVLFVGLACAVVVLSVVAKSRSLLTVGTIGLIAYICDFIAEHFAHNLNAPMLLMLAGFVLIAMGAVAVRINNRFIRERSRPGSPPEIGQG